VSLESWIRSSVIKRATTEVNLDPRACDLILPLNDLPPVVAAYTVHREQRHTVILPFILPLAHSFTPRALDATVYDAGWRDTQGLWPDITPTNRLIAAYHVWPKLSDQEKTDARPFLQEALEQAIRWAAEVGLPAPVAPWELSVRDVGEA
jgi:hypothetical protein